MTFLRTQNTSSISSVACQTVKAAGDWLMGLLLPKLLRKVGLAQQLILFPTFNHATSICKNLS